MGKVGRCVMAAVAVVVIVCVCLGLQVWQRVFVAERRMNGRK